MNDKTPGQICFEAFYGDVFHIPWANEGLRSQEWERAAQAVLANYKETFDSAMVEENLKLSARIKELERGSEFNLTRLENARKRIAELEQHIRQDTNDYVPLSEVEPLVEAATDCAFVSHICGDGVAQQRCDACRFFRLLDNWRKNHPKI